MCKISYAGEHFSRYQSNTSAKILTGSQTSTCLVLIYPIWARLITRLGKASMLDPLGVPKHLITI